MSANHEIPTHEDLMWPTLEAMKALGGSASIYEITNKVGEILNLTDEEMRVPHVDDRRTKIEYRLAWARTYLKLGGALENSSRGVWALTEKGEHLEFNDLIRLQQEINKNKRKKADKKSAKPENDHKGLPADVADEDWKSVLLSKIISMTPDGFERLTQRVLRESGFKTVAVTGRPGDGGIDGTGILQVKLVSFPISFQCKKYAGSVGSSAIRDFRGAIMGRSEKGLFITTGTFTRGAQQEATRDGALAIDLVDGDRLCEILKELSLGVETRLVEEITILERWFETI